MFSLSLVLMIGILLPGSGYSQAQPAQKRTVAAGQEATIKGVILSRSGETFVLRDMSRMDTVVAIDRHHQDQDRAKGPLPRTQAL